MNIIDQETCASAQHIANHLLPRKPKGGTYDPRTSRFPSFRRREKTYLVSIPGYEHRLHGVPNAGMLIDWLTRVQCALAVDQHYLGWWRDGDDWVFDISIAIDGHRDFILGLAKLWGQNAVYHPATEEVVYTASEFERAA